LRGKHRTEYIGSDSASLSGYIFELSFNILYVVLVGEERRNIWLCDRVVRFIMEKTVEEKILTLQKKKEDLFESTLGDSEEAVVQKLGEDDIKSLFA
jgi:predicted oxidoreductase (fatty acid repression mutant protein)